MKLTLILLPSLCTFCGAFRAGKFSEPMFTQVHTDEDVKTDVKIRHTRDVGGYVDSERTAWAFPKKETQVRHSGGLSPTMQPDERAWRVPADLSKVCNSKNSIVQKKYTDEDRKWGLPAENTVRHSDDLPVLDDEDLKILMKSNKNQLLHP